jgi:hypothetical protein
MKIATTKCKLCLEERDLKDSHIIPEFFYKPLYDEKHRFHVLSTTPEEKNIFEQKGIREKLLCFDCEQYFSQLEDYASKVFYGGVEVEFKNDTNKILIEGIDYTKFKLFQLSLLWRAIVSTVRLFSEVRVEQSHEEKLRKMLINKNPGEYYEYGCSIIGLLMEGKRLADEMILKPESLRVDGHRCCRFILGGCIWLFVVSKHSKYFYGREFFLSKDGKLIILLQSAENTKFIAKLVKDLKASGKL